MSKGVRPNGYSCEGCPDWDYVNGCWAGVRNIIRCPNISEDLTYKHDDWEDDIDDDNYEDILTENERKQMYG